ncbi:2225_t:CDS:2, partial [Racocetra persica]
DDEALQYDEALVSSPIASSLTPVMMKRSFLGIDSSLIASSLTPVMMKRSFLDIRVVPNCVVSDLSDDEALDARAKTGIVPGSSNDLRFILTER